MCIDVHVDGSSLTIVLRRWSLELESYSEHGRLRAFVACGQKLSS